jgi:hypothetical protein
MPSERTVDLASCVATGSVCTRLRLTIPQLLERTCIERGCSCCWLNNTGALTDPALRLTDGGTGR